MKMNKVFRISVTCMMCLLIMIMTSVIAKADVIWTPNDDFYNKNHNKCENVGRLFITKGSKGSVKAYKSPESSKVEVTFDNDTTFYVSFTYTDKKDVTWGVVESNKKTYWLKMKDLELVYDNISFCEEHENEFQEYKGEFDEYIGKSPILFWSYPESGVVNFRINEIEEKLNFTYTYTDGEGRLWGYVSYHYGSRGWICLSNPTDETISVTDIENIADTTPSATSNEFSLVLMAIILVVVLMAVTALLIKILWKKDTQDVRDDK